MRRSFAEPKLRALLLAALALAPLVAVACTSVTGKTPECTNDVTADGIQNDVDGGCTGHAVCAANPSKPAECCKDAAGKAYEGEQLQTCLFLYGVGAAPTSTSAEASSSASSGTGGGGGAGGGK